jgi:3-phytase
LLCGCSKGSGADIALPPSSLPTAIVSAKAETAPVATLDDAADDPAIWRNPDDPAASLIIATDKRAGIHVYNLAGKAISFTASPRLNNVDLRSGVRINGVPRVLVVASDRADIAKARIALFVLDVASRRLVPLANLPVGPGEAYGLCLWQRPSDSEVHAFVVMKDGRIDQMALSLNSGAPVATKLRNIKLGTQSEGCVVDDRTGQLYVAEEDVGLWHMPADAATARPPVQFAKADGQQIVMDAEGLAIMPQGADAGYLMASSQGDNAFALYRLPDLGYAGRFRIAAGAVDSVEETDGLEIAPGAFGPDYPNGLLVVQDGDNAPAAQNFKLVSWADVLVKLGLD